MGLREVQVEIQVLLAAPHNVEKSGGIIADFTSQLAQSHEFALTRGHERLFTAAVQMNHLHDGHLERVRVFAQRRQGAFHPRDVAVVIGPPHVDNPLESPVELLHVIGDVRGEVGGHAVLPNHHAILVVAKTRRLKPDGAVLVIGVTGIAQGLNGSIDGAAFQQRAFRVPAVEDHPEFLQIGAYVVEQRIATGGKNETEFLLSQKSPHAGNDRIHMGLLVATVLFIRGQVFAHARSSSEKGFAVILA